MTNPRNKVHCDVDRSFRRAIRDGNLETVRELINSSGLPFLEQRWTDVFFDLLLSEALQFKQVAVARLLTSGAKVNASTTLFKSLATSPPLNLAVRNGDIEIVKMIIEKGAKIDAEDCYGKTPLHFAVENGDIKIVNMIMDRGAKIDAKDHNGETPLYKAIANNKVEVTQLLLERKADVNVIDKNSTTPLHVAAKTGSLQIVESLLRCGSNVNCVEQRKGYTPLHFAVNRAKKRFILLLSKNLYVDVIGENNETPLHSDSVKGDLEIVKIILDRGAKIDAKDHNGETPLYKAIVNDEVEVTQLLLEHKADVNAGDKKGTTPLHVAARTLSLQVIESLLRYGGHVNCVEQSRSFTPLHFALERGNQISITLLSIKGSNVDVIGKNNEKFVKGHLEIVKIFLDRGAKIDAKDHNGETPLYKAIAYNQVEVAQLLLKHKADVNAGDKNGTTPLHVAAKTGSLQIVESLLRYGGHVNCVEQRKSFTPLQFALERLEEKERGSKQIIMLLLSKGANVDVIGVCNKTPLHIAVERGDLKIIKIILDKGANINAKDCKGQNPLCNAIKRNNIRVTELLLDQGADVNASDNEGTTLLHFAVTEGKEVSALLLNRGANIDARNGFGRTALHIACQGNLSGVVATLLEHGSDINITCKNNFTPLHYASKCCSIGCNSANKILIGHTIQLKTANLYVSKDNLQYLSETELLKHMTAFQQDCENEIASIESEKIAISNISFYDILVKGTRSLAIYMRNDNIVKVLKSGVYKAKFPIYAKMLENQFRRGMERKELLEQGIKSFHSLCPVLYSYCTDKIFSYLSVEDLRIFLNACKSFSLQPL